MEVYLESSARVLSGCEQQLHTQNRNAPHPHPRPRRSHDQSHLSLLGTLRFCPASHPESSFLKEISNDSVINHPSFLFLNWASLTWHITFFLIFLFFPPRKLLCNQTNVLSKPTILTAYISTHGIKKQKQKKLSEAQKSQWYKFLILN